MFLTKEENKVRQKQVERETFFNLQGDYYHLYHRDNEFVIEQGAL